MADLTLARLIANEIEKDQGKVIVAFAKKVFQVVRMEEIVKKEGVMSKRHPEREAFLKLQTLILAEMASVLGIKPDKLIAIKEKAREEIRKEDRENEIVSQPFFVQGLEHVKKKP